MFPRRLKLLFVTVVSLAAVGSSAAGLVRRRGSARSRIRHRAALRVAGDAGPGAAIGEEPGPRRERLRFRRAPTSSSSRARPRTGPSTITRSSARWAPGHGSSTSPIPPTRVPPAGTSTRATRTTSPFGAICSCWASTRSASSGATSACLRGQGQRHRPARRGPASTSSASSTTAPSATFDTQLIDCYLSSQSSAGAHTVTIHPSGQWISVEHELRRPRGRRHSVRHARSLAQFVGDAIVDDAHDVSFSKDGRRLYSAGLDSTRVVDVAGAVDGRIPKLLADDPERADGRPGRRRPDRSSFRTSPTRAPTRRSSSSPTKLAAALPRRAATRAHRARSAAPTSGRSRTSNAPRKLGTWVYPNPLARRRRPAPRLAAIGRTERACTIHVFRNGGNGSAGVGEIARGFGGVSSLPAAIW